MHKEFKVNIWRAGYFLGMILSFGLLCLVIFCIYHMIINKAPHFVIGLVGGCLFAFVVLVYVAFFYFNKLTIVVDGENVTYKLPDKTIKFSTKDIIKIERNFSYAGVGYAVLFYNEKHKKCRIDFTQDLQDSEQLIEHFEKKSRIKMRQEGTVDVKNEKRPFVRFLKIIFNIVMTLILFWLVVGWPTFHAWKH